MYNIAILHHCYQPDLQGDGQPSWHECNGNDLVTYNTVQDAQDQIDDWDDDIYVTDHNEIGRPTYVIISDMTADYIRSGRNQDMSNYDWDNAACDCGECDECMSMMIEQDREYILASDES